MNFSLPTESGYSPGKAPSESLSGFERRFSTDEHRGNLIQFGRFVSDFTMNHPPMLRVACACASREPESCMNHRV